MRSFGFLAIVVFLTGCSQQSADSQNPVEQTLSAPAESRLDVSDPQIEPVRKWLKENLDVPQWQEIRWYKPLSMGEEAGAEWTICRIKVRTSAGEGQKLRDLVFYHHKGKIEAAPTEERDNFRDQD